MRKGTFATPRPLGTVPEIRIEAVRVGIADAPGEPETIFAQMVEGEEVGPDFIVKERRQLEVSSSTMDAATQAALDNFLRQVIREYATQEGYTGVTVT